MPSWTIPTAEEVDRAIALLSYQEHRRYFFDRLQNPEWIGPLTSKGFFINPPESMPWPESRYLSRMASVKPEAVLEVILNFPVTRNPSIHEDVIQAALGMPPKLAAQHASRIKD